MAREWRSETCDECGAETRREWETSVIPVRMPIPDGWRVDEYSDRTPAWKGIARPTEWTTLCDCDVAE